MMPIPDFVTVACGSDVRVGDYVRIVGVLQPPGGPSIGTVHKVVGLGYDTVRVPWPSARSGTYGKISCNVEKAFGSEEAMDEGL